MMTKQVLYNSSTDPLSYLSIYKDLKGLAGMKPLP